MCSAKSDKNSPYSTQSANQKLKNKHFQKILKEKTHKPHGRQKRTIIMILMYDMMSLYLITDSPQKRISRNAETVLSFLKDELQ